MDSGAILVFMAASMILGLPMAVLLFAYEDGISFGLFKRLRCKMGWHRMNKNKYYCAFCKKPRKFPDLKVIEGEKIKKYMF